VTALVLLALASSRPPAPQVIGPRVSESPVVSYRFRSPRRDVRYRCAIDAARLRACRSPYRVRLSVGTHRLRVQAVDRRGRLGGVTKIRVRILEPRAPEVRVGVSPLDAIAVGDAIWTENFGDGTASIVDTSKRRVTSVTVGGVPGGIAYGAGSVWIGDFGDGTLTRLTTVGQVVTRIPLGGQSAGIAVSGTTAYVADYTGGLSRVDTTTNQVLGRTPLPNRAEAVAVGFGLVWVTDDAGNVTTLDPGTGAVVGAPIQVGSDADGISLTSDAVWAVALYGQALVRIDPVTRQVVTRVKTPGQASGVLASESTVWVSNYDLATVSKYDVAAGRFVKTYRVGRKPRSLAPAGGAVWVANQSSDSISRLGALTPGRE
jgi:streptogramin lyase